MKESLTDLYAYNSTRIAKFHNVKIAHLRTLLWILGIVAIAMFILFSKKYQAREQVVGAALTKLLGVSYSDNPDINPIWDVADYLIPPKEVNSFSVITNVLRTKGQAHGKCEEDPSISNAICKTDKECQPIGRPIRMGHGVTTGRCIKSTRRTNTKVCEIRAWCPVENLENPKSGGGVLKGAENITVFIKNWVSFLKFDFRRRNIDAVDQFRLKDTCHYNPKHPKNKYCPYFKINTILKDVNETIALAERGAVIAIVIEWNCDLDKPAFHCKPEYSFKRLDDKDTQISDGWSFRYASYYRENFKEKRDLTKARGIQFIIRVTGEAGKFNIYNLIFSIGACAAYTGGISVVCEFLLPCFERKSEYTDMKYHTRQKTGQLEKDHEMEVLDTKQ